MSIVKQARHTMDEEDIGVDGRPLFIVTEHFTSISRIQEHRLLTSRVLLRQHRDGYRKPIATANLSM